MVDKTLLQRSRDQWEKCDPETMSRMSAAAIFHALNDAKRDVLAMHSACDLEAERLDWLIEKQAWIHFTKRDGSILQCRVWTQDEDENYHVLSGEGRFFNTPREAIDAAIAKERAG